MRSFDDDYKFYEAMKNHVNLKTIKHLKRFMDMYHRFDETINFRTALFGCYDYGEGRFNHIKLKYNENTTIVASPYGISIEMGD